MGTAVCARLTEVTEAHCVLGFLAHTKMGNFSKFKLSLKK